MTLFSKALSVAITLALASPLAAEDHRVIVQSTTSTANSGLYDHLLPLLERDAGIDVQVVAVGTGQAIRNARNCDGDVLLVHAKSAEEEFVADGFGRGRIDLMFNDYVIVGPASDPASLAYAPDVHGAMHRVYDTSALFASRADDSGTHKKELALWSAAGLDPTPASGGWYRETGSGMGATLNIGVALGAYVLTDRASWVSFGNKGMHDILVEGAPELFNQYGIIAVDPAKCPNVNADGAQEFIDWMTSEIGQSAIAAFEMDGQQLFFPNAPDNPDR